MIQVLPYITNQLDYTSTPHVIQNYLTTEVPPYHTELLYLGYLFTLQNDLTMGIPLMH